MNSSIKVQPASPEEMEQRIAEYRRLGFERKAPAQVVYQDPHVICPWPDCGMRIDGIQFQLEKWQELEDRFLEAWWKGPGLVGRCPSCKQFVLFGLLSKSRISDPSSAISRLLPDDWNERANIVTKPHKEKNGENGFPVSN